MSEVVGGLSVREVAEGGAVFEIKTNNEFSEDCTETDDYVDAVEGFTKLECLDTAEGYDEQPFDILAKKMTNLLSDGKIKKRILREGYGDKPEPFSHVSINYNAYIQYKSLPFDSTYARKKQFSFTIAAGEVIEGLDLAVQSMQLNEKAQFLIWPSLAYRNGALKRIPPNSIVLFEVELCGTMEPAPESVPVEEKDFSHIYQFCLGQCVKGKRMFRANDYHSAIKEYKTAIQQLEKTILTDYDEQLKWDEMMVRLNTNLLICYTHIENGKKGCIHGQEIIKMAKNKTFTVSAKVHFNFAKCLRMVGNYSRAQHHLNEAKKLEPHNPEIQQEFSALTKAREQKRNMEKSMARALVNR